MAPQIHCSVTNVFIVIMLIKRSPLKQVLAFTQRRCLSVSLFVCLFVCRLYLSPVCPLQKANAAERPQLCHIMFHPSEKLHSRKIYVSGGSIRLARSSRLYHVIIIIIITKTISMVLSSWQSHCKSSPGSFDECWTAPSGRWPKTNPDNLGCESTCTGCQKLHPPSPSIIITQPESWYSFYRPTEGRRLSRPSWLVTYRDGLPVHRRSPILVLTWSDVAQLRWSRPTRYH